MSNQHTLGGPELLSRFLSRAVHVSAYTRSIMSSRSAMLRELLALAGIVGGWILLQLVILPKLGFST
jgi:hypothetical protein